MSPFPENNENYFVTTYIDIRQKISEAVCIYIHSTLCVLHGIAWCGMLCGMACCGMLCGMPCGMVWCGMLYVMTWCGRLCGMAWCAM